MTGPLDGVSTERRRTFLQLVGATAGTGAIRAALDVRADSHESIVMEQGDRCVELQALSGDEPVEELYDYTYPRGRFEGPPGSDGYSFSSEGTTALQRDRTSILFLYDGPEGLSLVVVHGHSGGDRDEGGAVSFAVSGLPESATWVVRDDYYLEQGEQADTNFDRWDVDGGVHVVDWAYAGGRTDGGAVRDLGSVFEVTVDPAFNDDAALAADHDFGQIEAWEVLSGDLESPERFPLRLDQPVTIRTGTCVDVSADGETVDDEEVTDEDSTDDGQTNDESTDDASTEEESTDDASTDTEEPTNDEEVTDDRSSDETSTDDEGTTDDTEATDEAETADTEELSEDEGRSKHERKQRKHQEKHERKQRKHQEKHERKQRKHQKKHEKKQRKHQKKHERKQRKHRKHDD